MLRCSARGCRSAAAWGLRWNNPRLHPPERRKTWLACDLHVQDLASFLGSRGFLREQIGVEELLQAETGPADSVPVEER